MRSVMAFPRRPVPRMARVRQRLPSEHIDDVRGEVRQRLLSAGLARTVPAGARIAIAAGSRGLGGFVDLLGGIVDAVTTVGGVPFIVPAMGSHGGATAEGQSEILARLNVSASTVQAPVMATMETVELGRADSRALAHLDRLAADADGIIVLGRTKTHPESAGDLASGLLKMMAVGLGKQRGAQEAHSHGLWNSVRSVPRLQLARSKVLFGVAVVENGFRQPVAIEVVPASYDAFLDADVRLLRLAKTHLARIPVDDLDVLVVDALGKTESGAGMDPNVIGHRGDSGASAGPRIGRLVVLSLTDASLGNGLGIGVADFTTDRFARAYDPKVTYVNQLTAAEPGGAVSKGRLPLCLPSDQEAVEVALASSFAGAAARVCRITSTAELAEFWVSEALLDEASRDSALTILDEPSPMAFDVMGNLLTSP